MDLTEVLVTGGYVALALLILIENLFPPIPSEVILPLAGFLVGQGQMAYVPAVIAATIGSVSGALIIYGVARRGGRPLVERLAPKVRLSQADLDRGDEWFARYGAWFVIGGRLVPGIRSVVSIPAGLAEMPRGRFVLLTTIGSLTWNAVLIGLGVLLGQHWDRIAEVIEPISTVAGIALALGAVAFIIWLVRR